MLYVERPTTKIMEDMSANETYVSPNRGTEYTNTRIGEEHPLCDYGQIFFISLFLIVWVLDTAWFDWPAFPYLGSLNWMIRGSIAFFCVIAGIYFEKGSHKVLLNNEYTFTKIIDYDVFSIVRHPTYLGVLLILLGLFFWSSSLASFAVWTAFFIFYDFMARYEEENLTEIFGTEYTEYKKKVRKWIPIKKIRIKPVKQVYPVDSQKTNIFRFYTNLCIKIISLIIIMMTFLFTSLCAHQIL